MVTKANAGRLSKCAQGFARTRVVAIGWPGMGDPTTHSKSAFVQAVTVAHAYSGVDKASTVTHLLSLTPLHWPA